MSVQIHGLEDIILWPFCWIGKVFVFAELVMNILSSKSRTFNRNSVSAILANKKTFVRNMGIPIHFLRCRIMLLQTIVHFRQVHILTELYAERYLL